MTSGILQYGLAVALAAHGVAHLPGFAVSWRLVASAECPRQPLLGGRLGGDGTGARFVGILCFKPPWLTW